MARHLLILSWLCLFSVAVLRAEENKASHFPPLPAAVSSFGAIACEGYVYIYGGHVGKSHSYDTTSVLNTLHRCALEGGKEWEVLPAGEHLQGTNLASYKGKIYLVGGMQPRNAVGAKADLHSVADCSCYDPAKKVWEKLAPLPAGRSSHEVVVAGDKLVVVGGWQMRGLKESTIWAKTALTLDLSKPNAKWESTPQPFERRAMTLAAIGDKVYAIAGLNGEGESERTVDILDCSTGKWSKGPDIPGDDKAGFSPAACTLNDRIILNTSAGPVFRLSAKGDAWEKVGEVKIKRIVHRLVPVGKETVLVLGGAGSEGNVTEVETVKIPQ
ncbi:hypothetical protein KIH39_04470 [Telmatocola sphagniphila]|uniref:N-acetylneuraminate epimerase n=1 Tax=Telmatocola sphagniphila TaxID=1123043 RepID=A0A8E6B792_9BACT|nr:hypothetical protein [Telmatocola sphagniphila]QVL33178.1 hypothetical protein KIH39_04470 [Telmatocola sphagniphila]